ncbi:MAG: DNA-binding protein WhiA [Lachnospiraceae bacterium]|nr:DNA-binding protein WhiA [Lachnospiraceae bacterium]
MSFSGDVKEELSKQLSNARHCQIAEMSAILSMSGQVLAKGDDQFEIYVYTENLSVARKFFILIRRCFQVVAEVSVRMASVNKNRTYLIAVRDTDAALRILQAARFPQIEKDWDEEEEEHAEGMEISPILIQNACCKRAFIRGAYLAGGSMSDPNKSYHYEIVCLDLRKAEQLQEMLASFQVEARIVERKKYYVVYVKDAEAISEALNVMEAHVSMMDFENIRIMKELRSTVNRKVNCETANINKTVSAASQQIADIRYIEEVKGLEALPDNLEEMARVRLKYPEIPLKELGGLLDPPVGKSGVNHRLRRLKEIADHLRQENEEQGHD